ncbi:hypothetical protein MUK42_11721 [Musa troglodytarum]|uniref:Uncharacterized protein n=1 Tax=Musa troglodytarum TaxID=320322 RepID=A0A9E7KK38_9LILI|nr:hypothetical protein MUK42_11721 [Musa troglodytarum]
MAICSDEETHNLVRSLQPSLPSSHLLCPCHRAPPRRSASLSPRRRPSIPEWNPVISGDGREEEEVRPVVLNDREYADGFGRIEDQGIRGGVPAKFLYRESAPAYRRVKEKR